MLIEIMLALFLGILVGTLTGLIPGIHINLIGVFLISLSASLFISINPNYLLVFIVSVAITHTFVDFIPSIFLGCPDTDTELSILPGHELLKQGQGYEAVILTCYGSLAASIILILLAFPSVLLLSKIYGFVLNFLPYLLLAIIGFLIYLEKKRATAFFVLLLTGILGLIVLNLPVKEPLLPLLTGLFGSSMLIGSIKNKIQIPKQQIQKPKIKLFKPLLGATIASPLCCFLPGLGSGQAAIIGNAISRTDRKGFLVLLGATNTLVMGFSFISLYAITKARTGAAIVIQELMGNISLKILVLILLVILISSIISFFITIALTKFFSKKIEKINYTILSSIILGFLCILIFSLSSFFGLIVFIVSTLTGIYCISLGVKRTNMMGCLLIPTIILYLF